MYHILILYINLILAWGEVNVSWHKITVLLIVEHILFLFTCFTITSRWGLRCYFLKLLCTF